MKAGAAGVEDADAIEWCDAELVLPVDVLAGRADRHGEARARRGLLVGADVVKDVLGGAHAGGALEHTDETGFAGTVLPEDDGDGGRGINLPAHPPRTDARAKFHFVDTAGVRRRA